MTKSIPFTSAFLPAFSFALLFALCISSCKSKVEKTKPIFAPITESVYASGILKSEDQYEAFLTVSGNIEQIYVAEGDRVKKGQVILSISNEAQRLGRENAALVARFSDANNNQEKLKEASVQIELARNKLSNDSALYSRQKALWQDQIGTKVELEARTLAYRNAKTVLYSAQVKYDDLKRQINFTSSQSKKNLLISSKQENDYTLRSEMDGMVYSLPKKQGEIVNPQTVLAIVGNPDKFILEMQVDEYDILSIKKGLTVLVTLDSYKTEVFEAHVSKIYPIMNERSKTFLVEAVFKEQPKVLYPNISFEASIVLQVKNKALLIPRNYLFHDSLVIQSNGDTVKVKTGLKDYQKIEILSGISAEAELQKPKE